MPKKFFDIIPPNKIDSTLITADTRQKVKRPRISRTKPKGIFLKVLFFCLVFLTIFGAAGFVFFSKLKIEIWPETEILGLEETITVDLNIKEVDSGAGIIPGKIFTDQKAASENFSASGRVVKEAKAKGVIRVYNASDNPRAIIPSRFVSAAAEGKLFRSTEQIVIPAGKYEKGKLVPGEIDVEVVAAEAGEEYNIGPSTFALPALAGTSSYTTIYGKSFSAMTGGFRGEVSQVLQEDLDNAKNTLTDRLKKESEEFLKSALPTDFILLDKTISQEIIESKSSVGALDEADSFDYQVKVKSEGVGFKESDLKNLAKSFVSQETPEDKIIQEESLEIVHSLRAIDKEGGKIILDLKIKAKVYSDINLTELKKALVGKSLKEIKIFLENLPQITKIEIKSRPFLKKKAPEDIEKIQIKMRLDPYTK